MDDPFESDLTRRLVAERYWANADRQVMSSDGRPEFAELVAMLREERLSRIRPRLRLLNPFEMDPERLVDLVMKGRRAESVGKVSGP